MPRLLQKEYLALIFVRELTHKTSVVLDENHQLVEWFQNYWYN